MKPRFVHAAPFSESVAALCENPCNYIAMNGRFSGGYINHSGQFVIPPQFFAVYSFAEGLARMSWGDDNINP